MCGLCNDLGRTYRSCSIAFRYPNLMQSRRGCVEVVSRKAYLRIDVAPASIISETISSTFE